MTTDLHRFDLVHKKDFNTALSEIRSGMKRSHWMWYIFPQLQGLGSSETARQYAITDIKEAESFLMHPVLGRNLIQISEELLKLETNDALKVFGSPDDLKLRSSMTLFASLPQSPAVFKKVLDKFFDGMLDPRTVSLLWDQRF